MATVQYASLTDLAAERADAGNFLRWVRDVKSWYQSDGTSVAVADNNNIVAPTVGVGRWVKQNSTNPTTGGLTWSSISSNITATVGNGYFVDNTAGIVTITLPTVGIQTGQQIGFFASVATTGVNRLVVNPVTLKINDVVNGYALIAVNDFAVITFVNDTKGWVVTSTNNSNAFKIQLASYFVASPVTLPNTLGIMDYLGKQKNTLSYQSPAITTGGRTKRVALVSGLFAGLTPTSLFDKIGNSGWFIYGTTTNVQSPLVLDFLTGLVRPDSLEICINNSDWLAQRTSKMLIYGANNVTNDLESAVRGVDSLAADNADKIYASFTDIKLLANLTNVNNAANWTLSGADYWTLLPINSQNYYRYIIIQQYGINNGNNFNERSYIQEIEMFGDVIAP